MPEDEPQAADFKTQTPMWHSAAGMYIIGCIRDFFTFMPVFLAIPLKDTTCLLILRSRTIARSRILSL